MNTFTNHKEIAMNNVSNETVMVVCHADANHCNICGAFFAEGDNVCEHQHFIGQAYPMEVHS